jgi:hypothetical protein
MISFVRKCISLAFSFKKHELDFESDSNESISEEHENTTGMILIMKIKMKTIYQEMRVFDSINPALGKSYFRSNINSTKKHLQKLAAAWILSKDKPNLSSDCLKRVMTRHVP